MTDRDINIRSVLFLVVGILLALSLIICVYIVVNEKDLIKTEATVVEVKKDNEGTGKNNISVVYVANGEKYEYNFRYKDEINKNDKIIIYYHENSVTSVQTYKTSKIIFICPIIGLVLCGLGVYDLFRKNKKEGESVKEEPKEVKPKVQVAPKVVEEPEEPLKEIPKSNLQLEAEIPVVKKEVPVKPVTELPKAAVPAKEQNVSKESSVVTPDKLSTKVEEKPAGQKKDSSLVEASSMKSLDEVTEKVRKTVSQNINNDSTDDDIKNVIKEVLKEVIKEVKEEEKPDTKVVQKRIIPNYFYISGTSLIYEEMGKKSQEVNLKDIKKVVRTINSAGSVVKLVVSNDEYKIVLTNMKNIDLEQLANLLHNKMRTIDDTFKEIIERKEY